MLIVGINDGHTFQLARERVLGHDLESLRCLRRFLLEANARFLLRFDDGSHRRLSHFLVAISEAGGGKAGTSELQLR